MDFSKFSSPATILVVLVVWEGIRWGINFGLKRLTGNDFMTRLECSASHAEDEDTVKKIEEELSQLRKIMLVVAVKVGVPPEEYKDLVH